MDDLIRRMRAARRRWVERDGIGFEIQRPTALEIAELRGRGNRAFLEHCITGWRGLRELDLVPAGSTDPAPFSAEVAVEWIGDRPEWSAWISEQIGALIEEHARAEEAARGN